MVATPFLSQLVNIKGLKCPIYTRAELIEKFKDGLAIMEPSQLLHLKVRQFEKHKQPCSVIEIFFLFGLSPPTKQPIAIEAMIDEVSDAPPDSFESSGSISTGSGTFADGQIYSYHIHTTFASAPKDLVEKLRALVREKIIPLPS